MTYGGDCTMSTKSLIVVKSDAEEVWELVSEKVKYWAKHDYEMLNGGESGAPKDIWHLLLMMVAYPLLFVSGTVTFLIRFLQRVHFIFTDQWVNEFYAVHTKKDYESICSERSRIVKIKEIPMHVNDIDEIVFESEENAELVISDLVAIINLYGSATIADFCEAAGIAHDYTRNYYGWKDLSSATIKKKGNGYIIKMPSAINLNED